MLPPDEEPLGEETHEVPQVIIPDPGDGDLVEIEFAVAQTEPALAVRLAGPHIGEKDMQVDLAAAFLSSLDRLIRGVSAKLAGLSIPKRGRIPTPTGMVPIHLSSLAFGQSVILYFTVPLRPNETTPLFRIERATYSIRAAERLTELLQLGASDELIDGVRDLGDRIGNEFVELVSFLAERDLETDWKVRDEATLRVSSQDAAAARAHLRAEDVAVEGEVEMTGELFRADSRRNSFRLDTEEGESVAGTYTQDLEDTVRRAWAKTVTVMLRRTEYRWRYSEDPHEIVYELVEVLRTLD